VAKVLRAEIAPCHGNRTVSGAGGSCVDQSAAVEPWNFGINGWKRSPICSESYMSFFQLGRKADNFLGNSERVMAKWQANPMPANTYWWFFLLVET